MCLQRLRTEVSLTKDRKGGVGHCLIASVVRVKMIATVIGRLIATWVCRIVDHLIEVDHGIEGATCANPPVEGLTNYLAFRSIVDRSFEGSERCAYDLDVMQVAASDDLLHRLNQVCSGDYLIAEHALRTVRCADVVDTLKDNYGADARLVDYVAIEAGEGVC